MVDHFSGKNHGKTLKNVKLMKLIKLPQVAGHEGLEEEPNRRFQVGSGAVVAFLRSITGRSKMVEILLQSPAS